MHGFESTRDAISQGIVAAILVGVFALLSADRIHRVLVPIGAVALIWLISYFSPFRLLSFEAAQKAVDLNVILLLFSMMALVGVLKTTNVFPWAVDRLLMRSRGNPSRALSFVIWFTGVLSALLDNVTTVIFTYPMAASMAQRLRINGSAFLLPMVMAANIGGTATLIGDPPNVLIGADPRSGLTFLSFIENLAVACTFMLIVLVWYSRRYYPADVGSAAAELLLETGSGVRVVELEGPRRITPNEIGGTLTGILGRPVQMEIVPHADWAGLFKAQGAKNPGPRMRMIDGFNEGWIEFTAGEAGTRKGTTELADVLDELAESALSAEGVR